MNKKVIAMIIVFVLVFWVVGILKKNGVIFKTAETSVTNSTEIKNEENLPSEITIYDIEEGYLKVPYNKQADKHSYDWKNLDRASNYKYEDDTYTSKLGIDVSSYQKNINWKEVKNSGVDFAILRIGYRGYGEAGKIVLDPSFEQNYKEAKKAGIEVGVYFFSQAINNDEIQEEANFVINHLKGKEITYPVVYDLEKIKNDTGRTDNLTIDEITNMSLEFCKIIKEKGYTPSIYGNAKTFTTKMKLEQFNDICKWYADYQEEPLYPYEFELWQYTESGKIKGISSNVDINIQFIKK